MHDDIQGMRILPNLEVWEMGIVSYADALKLQEKLVSARKAHKSPSPNLIVLVLNYTK